MVTATTSRARSALPGAVRPFRLQGRQRMGGDQRGQGEAYAEVRLYAAWPRCAMGGLPAVRPREAKALTSRGYTMASRGGVVVSCDALW